MNYLKQWRGLCKDCHLHLYCEPRPPLQFPSITLYSWLMFFDPQSLENKPMLPWTSFHICIVPLQHSFIYYTFNTTWPLYSHRFNKVNYVFNIVSLTSKFHLIFQLTIFIYNTIYPADYLNLNTLRYCSSVDFKTYVCAPCVTTGHTLFQFSKKTGLQELINTYKYHVFAPMGRFQLELIYLYFSPSFHQKVVVSVL